MTRRLLFLGWLGLFIALAGCASSGYVQPANIQHGSVTLQEAGDQFLLVSERSGSTVAVSLRRATPEFLMYYVSVENTGSEPLAVRPEDMRIVAGAGDAKETFRPFAMGEMRSVASNSTTSLNESEDLADIFRQSLYYDKEAKTSSESSAYAMSGGSSSSAAQLLFRPSTVESGGAADGFVYTPFSPDYENVSIRVRVGDGTVHRFEYQVSAN